jgi:hypothetical protein
VANFYLYAKPIIKGVHDEASKRQKGGIVSVTSSKSLERLKKDDFVILAQPGEQFLILPYLFRVYEYVSKNNQLNMHLRVEEIYGSSIIQANSLQISDLSTEIKGDAIHRLQENIFHLIIGFLSQKSKDLYREIASQTSSIGRKSSRTITEKEMLELVKNHISQRGYFFPEETIDSFHVSLKTRPFVILTGFSGMGKSKLPQLYAEALGYEDNFLLLPVKPNWSDEQHILGFIDPINRVYVQEPLTEFLIQATNNREQLYFVCLDEMNLAYVEEYFASFLSVMEQDDPQKREIKLYSESTKGWLESKNSVPKEISLPVSPLLIPPNIFFIGTINSGKNTYNLSNKVIDRANILEFYRAELTKIPPQNILHPGVMTPVPASQWQSYRAAEPDGNYYPQLEEIEKILSDAMIGIGYRIARQISWYIAHSKGIFPSDVAFDLQVKQRILPLVRGPQINGSLIKKLKGFFIENNLTKAAACLEIIGKRVIYDSNREDE